jgi:O-antigen/teichoic acid export membrane protein
VNWIMSELDPSGNPGSGLRDRLTGVAFSRTARNTYWLGSSSVLNGILGAVASALLARGLGVEHFGTYTLLLTLVNLLADLSDLGLASALLRFGAERIGRGETGAFGTVLSAILRLKAVLAVVVLGLAAAVLYPLLPALFGHVDERIASYILLTLGTSLLSILAGIFPPVLQAFGDFRAGAITSLARSLSRVLLVSGAVTLWAAIDVRTALWIDAGSVFVFLIAGYLASPVRRFNAPPDPEMMREIIAFTRWVSLYQLIILLGTKLDVFIVGGLADARTLSMYGAAAKVSGLVTAVTNSYYTVLLSTVSLAAASADAIATRARQARLITAGLSGAMVVLALLADPVVRLLYGTEYLAAVPVLQVMCIGLIFTVLAYPVSAVLFARKKTAVFPVMALLSAGGLIAGNVILLPLWGATGAAVAFSTSAFLAWITATIAGRTGNTAPERG